MQRKQFRAKKAVRMRNSMLNRGPRQRGRGDGGYLLPDLIAPLPVDKFTREKLSRECADLSAQLRKLDAFDEQRSGLEQKIFWLRQRMAGECA